MRDIERDNLIELVAQRRCVICHRPYGRDGVRILGRRDDTWMIAVTCRHCRAQALMVASPESQTGDIHFTRQQPQRPPIMYDVTYEEWLAFQQKPPISEDDVLDMHEFLKDFDGDFQALFGQRGSHDEQDTEPQGSSV